MKRKFSFILMTALIAAAFTSCDQVVQTEDNPAGLIAVNLNAGIKPASTYVANDQWEATDEVGLYMKKTGQSLTAVGAVYDDASNVQMSIAGQTLSSNPPLMYPISGNVDFVGYYPYTASVNTDFTIPVNIAGQAAGLPVEILYSNNITNQAPTESTVTLNFKYSLAKIEVTVTGGANSNLVASDFADATAAIEGLYTQAELQLADGSFTDFQGKQPVTLHRTSVTATSAVFEALVLPVNDEITFQFDVGGVVYEHKMTVNYASETLYKYNFSLDFPDIQPATATLLNAVIIPRDEAPEQDISIDASDFATNGNVGPRPNTADDPPDGIYVSPTGSDNGATGAKDKPYKSINTALAAAQPGATIILRGGTYAEGRDVRIRTSNITMKSAKGEWAVIDLTTYDSGNDEHSGVEFYAENSVTGGIVTGCKLQNLEVKGGFYAVCFETKWEWGQAERNGASNIIVEDCILHDSRNDVVKVKPGCDNITIRYNEIYNSGRAFVNRSDFNTGENNSEGIDNVNGDNMHVHNNYIHDICSNGIYAKGGAINALIENNIVARTYGAGLLLGFDTSPQYFDLTVNPKYYENISGIIRNNLIIDAGWEGIGLYASIDAQVYHNTIVNAACGILKYHSPIYFGIATQDWGNPAGCPPNINPNIHHNIVSQPSTYTNRIIDIRYVSVGDVYASRDIPSLDGNPTMNNNCYYVAGRSATFTDNRPPAVSNMNLAAWQSHITGDNGTIEVDPALDANYMPANPLCAEMGIQTPLKTG